MISQDGVSNRWGKGAHMKEGLIREGGGRIVDREGKRGGGNRALLHGDRMLINWGFNS